MRALDVRVALAASLVLALAARAQPVTYTWTGATDTNWSTSTNWNPAGPPVPGNGDTVIVGGAGTIVMDIDGDIATLNVPIAANFSGAGGALGIGAGGLNRTGGNLTMDGTLAIVLTTTQAWNFTGGVNAIASNIIGTGFTLTKTGLGAVTLSGDNSQLTAIVLNGGSITAGSATALAGSPFTLTAGTLNLNAPNSTDFGADLLANGPSGTLSTSITAGNRYTIGALTVNLGTALTVGALAGSAGTVITTRGLTLNGSISKTSSGSALWISGPFSGTGGITLRTSGANPIGGALDQGLHFAQTNTVGSPITNGSVAGFATILGADSGATLTYTGALNMGALGTLVLTPRTSSTIVIGASGTVTTSQPMVFRGDGTGTLRFNAAFVYPAVAATVDNLTLETNGSPSTLTAMTFTTGTWSVQTAPQTYGNAVLLNGATGINTGQGLTLTGALNGAGAITKSGAATLTIAGGNHSGGIALPTNAGNLTITGALTGEGNISIGANDVLTVTGGASVTTTGISVASGGTLQGSGTISGGVNMAGGSNFTPGTAGAGTLTTGALTLADTTNLNFTAATPPTSTSATVGALTLDGVLNITAGAGFGQGTYTLFNFSGTVTNNNLRLGSNPGNGFSYDYLVTLSPNQVLLKVGPAATAVELVGFEAVTGGGVTQVTWEAGTEIRNLGYRVYREQGSRRVQITPGLIAGSALRAGFDPVAGRNYAFTDANGGSGARYWLEAIDMKGQSQWFGPAQARSGSTSGKQFQQAMLLSNVGSDALLAERGPTGRPVDPPGYDRSWNDRSLAAQWAVASMRAVKLLIRQDGVYRVSADVLLAAGLPAGAALSSLQLWAGGRQVAFRALSANGATLQAGDALEFFGQAADTRYTDARVYWVTAGLGAPTFIDSAPAVQPSSYATSFLETLEIRDRTLHITALKNPDTDGFFGKPIIGTQAMDRTFSTPAIDLTSAESAVLEVSLQGLTDGAHAVDVKVNGTMVGTVQSVFQDVATVSFTLPVGALVAGDNTVTLVGRTGTEIAVEISQRLTYPRQYAFTGPLRFTAPGGAFVQLVGSAAASAHVLDVTSVLRPAALAGTPGDGAASITVPGSGNRILYAYRDQDVLTPAVVANTPSSWHSAAGANLVVIGPRALLPSLQPLADQRTREGLRVALVDVEDVYDEFSAGSKDATAIRSFLAYAASHWSTAPQYLLLAGAATYDPRGWLGHPELDQVPTLLIQTRWLETASDDALVTFDPGDGPAMAVGRLPVSTPAEMDAVVAKILNRKLPGTDSSLLFVRDQDGTIKFSDASAEVRSALSTWKSQELARNGDDVATHTAILDALRAGPFAVDYQGHGAEDFWAGRILSSTDADALSNSGSPTLLVAATCLNAYFLDIGREALGSALLRAPQGGAWAVWASSALTLPTEHATLSRALLTGALDRGLTLGQATLEAKKAVQDSDVRATFHLLGDPSARATVARSSGLTTASAPRSGASSCGTPGAPIAAAAPVVFLVLGLVARRRRPADPQR